MDKLNSWLGVVTNVWVIVGLVLVAYQIAQTNDALEIERAQWATAYRWDRSEQYQDSIGRIVESPELSSIWRRGRLGEPLSVDDQYRFSLLSENYFWLQWNSNRNELSRLGLLGPQPHDPDGPLLQLVQTVQQYPGMRAELDRWLEQYELQGFGAELKRVEQTSGSSETTKTLAIDPPL